MRGKKKKLIKELEMELEELIANSGQSKDNIHNNDKGDVNCPTSEFIYIYFSFTLS